MVNWLYLSTLYLPRKTTALSLSSLQVCRVIFRIKDNVSSYNLCLVFGMFIAGVYHHLYASSFAFVFHYFRIVKFAFFNCERPHSIRQILLFVRLQSVGRKHLVPDFGRLRLISPTFTHTYTHNISIVSTTREIVWIRKNRTPCRLAVVVEVVLVSESSSITRKPPSRRGRSLCRRCCRRTESGPAAGSPSTS